MDKDELVIELGKLLLQDKQVSTESWEDLVFVGEIRTHGHSGYGFLYKSDNLVSYFAPSIVDGSPIYHRLRELHEVMREDWKFCIVRLHRVTSALSMDFEYDPQKWKMTPAKLETLKNQLRPNQK